MRAFDLASLDRDRRPGRRWGQLFADDQRGCTLRRICFLSYEFGGCRHQRRRGRIRARQVRRRAGRLHPLDAARLYRLRRNAGQRRKRLRSDQRHWPIHHVPLSGDEPRPGFVFRPAWDFCARYLRGRAARLLAFDAVGAAPKLESLRSEESWLQLECPCGSWLQPRHKACDIRKRFSA